MNTAPNSQLRVLTRVCNSTCAPLLLHCICCFLQNRLLTTWFTVDSTNPWLWPHRSDRSCPCTMRIIVADLASRLRDVINPGHWTTDQVFWTSFNPIEPYRTPTCLALYPAHPLRQPLTPREVVATAGRDRAALHAASTRGRSIRPPSLAYGRHTLAEPVRLMGSGIRRSWRRRRMGQHEIVVGVETPPADAASHPRPGTPC